MKKTNKNMGLGMAYGSCIGLIVGALIGSFGIPLCLLAGMLIGLAIGKRKDDAVNEQVIEKSYKIQTIDLNEKFADYDVTVTDKKGNKKSTSVSAKKMKQEQFKIGDIVFMDDKGNIEQAFDANQR